MMKTIWRLVIILMAVLKIGIFGKTKERAFRAFEQYIEKIEPEKIKYIKRNKFNPECVLFDGTMIRAVSATDSARGYKFDKIIYDDDIDDKILNCIVQPCLINPMWSFTRAGLDL